MNTYRLASHYPTITPAERLSLLMAAWARGDQQECNHLEASAPSVAYRAPHYFALTTAFRELCVWHRMEVLALAALYLYGMTNAKATDVEEGEQLLDISLWFGYRLKVDLDGWRQFCEGQKLDPGPYMACLPGETVLDLAARVATERAAFTAEDALACMRRHGIKAAAAPTAEAVAAGLRKSLETMSAWWAG
jgi:hypothetical protein